MKIRKINDLSKLTLVSRNINLKNVEYTKNGYNYNVSMADNLNLIVVTKEEIKSEKYEIQLFEIID